MKYPVLLVLAVLILALFVSSQIQARGYALLQYTAGYSGYHYFGHTTDVFSYSDSLNGVMLASGFVRNSYFNADGEITQSSTNYNINHSVTNFPSGTQIVYDCFDNVGEPYYHQTLIYDNYNRLVYKSDDHDFIRQFRRFINPVTGLNDSLILQFNQVPQFAKITFLFDSLNRVSTQYVYSSNDSTSWIYVGSSTFEYGTALPINLALYEPETLCLGLLGYIVDEQYSITSQTTYTVSSGYTETIPYNIPTTNPFTYNVGFWTPPDIYKFNNNGRLISYSITDYPSTTSFTYTWGDYTTAYDEVYVPQHFSVYPNPFTNQLKIKIDTGLKLPVEISVFNLRGQLIRKWHELPGKEIIWNATDNNHLTVSSGIYLIRIKQGSHISSQKIIKF